MKVNLGAGRRPMDGWVNVDCVPLPGIDHVIELDGPDKIVLPWPDDTVDEFALIHCLEHLRYPLPLMEAAWRAARPGTTFTIACPYGSSDDADEDPTHVRRIFLNSFLYFSQPAYFRADYGYRGDWELDHLVLDLPAHYKGVSNDDVMHDLLALRNVVAQITAVLHAVKPAREPLQKYIVRPRIQLRIMD